MTPPHLETYPALSAIPGLRHGFLLRGPEVAVDCEREEALERLRPFHEALLAEIGLPASRLATGEQVHGCSVEIVAGPRPAALHFPSTDALATAVPGQGVGVWVADCAAVYLVDPVRRACGIAHSGKKGTEQGIVPAAVARMIEVFGTRPRDLVIQIAPCIRPPAYEVDFAAQIAADCLALGLPPAQVHDCGVCTSRDLRRYYSYRAEKGRTGRLFAAIGFDEA